MSGVVISLDGLWPQREPSQKAPEPAQSMADHVRPALEKYVASVYRDVLGRDATSSELSDWTAQILTGTSRNTVALCLLNSEERRRRVVRTYFDRFLGRAPNAEGLAFWTNFLASGKSHEDLIAALIASEEALAQGKSNDEFVRALFQELFHRKANSVEVASWVGLLTSGVATHFGVVQNFLTSREFRCVAVRRWYLEILRHEPDVEGLNYWVEQLNKGQTFEKIMAGLFSNNEYFSRCLLTDA